MLYIPMFNNLYLIVKRERIEIKNINIQKKFNCPINLEVLRVLVQKHS